MQTIVRTLVSALTLLACTGSVLPAQDSKSADAKEIAAYRLTAESWTKIQKAMRTVIDAAKRDPKVHAELTKDDESEAVGDMSISQFAKKTSELKPLADALRQVGMTPREYAVWMMAFLEAATVVSLKQAGMANEAPKNVNPANVKFVEDHMAEMAAIQQEFERIRKDP